MHMWNLINSVKQLYYQQQNSEFLPVHILYSYRECDSEYKWKQTDTSTIEKKRVLNGYFWSCIQGKYTIADAL